jgi:DNA helicase-2/ATP-dependent DNA helicase PcrA
MLSDPDADDLEDELNPPDKVFISTIHRAKGLEFSAVLLPFWIEGSLPHSMAGEETEEERRLAYVAVTRAKDRAMITYSTIPQGDRAPSPSRFLTELGFTMTGLPTPL